MNSAKNSKKGKDKLFYNFCHDFVKVTGAIPSLLWLRPKLYYPYGKINPHGGVIVIANHNSPLDPLIIFLAFPKRRLHCLATKDLYANKVASKFFEYMHCIKVDRENFSISAFHDVVERLSQGKAIAIFPEGQLNESTKSFLAFKSGTILMAHKANAPILPVYIVKRTKRFERQRIVIGQPINIREILGDFPSMESITQASDILREKEIELREYFESLPIYQKLSKDDNTHHDNKIEGQVQ